MSRKLFTNVMIFDGNGPDLVPGEVLVQGNRIQSVAGPGESLPREGCEVTDGGGATLMPGMINTHCLSWSRKIGQGYKLYPVTRRTGFYGQGNSQTVHG